MKVSTLPIQGSIHERASRKGILPAREPPIRFGTDGWRGRIADEITISGMRRCAAGISSFLHGSGKAESAVAIGFDGRFLSDRFAAEIARCLRRDGFVPLLSPEAVPTPALSLRVVTARASMGVMITASHNPPEYGGVKLKDSDGGTLDPGPTEILARGIPSEDPAPAPAEELPGHPSFLPSYVRTLKRFVALDEIRKARRHIVADSMHGMGGLLLERIVSGGRTRVRTLRDRSDPLFGGSNPEPVARSLGELFSTVRRERADAGFATDGDGDRIAACDERGRFLSPLTLLPVLALHWIENRGAVGGIAKTFAGSLRMERIARRHGLPFYELPVGFKHVAGLLRRGAIFLGGEESGGFGFQGFIPERDGILSALLLLEAMALSDRSLSGLVARMEKEYGRTCYDRIDLACAPALGLRITSSLADAPPKSLAGMTVTNVSRLDGVKLVFGEDGWVLFRASGTEPILRLYCEAPSAARVKAVLRHAVRLVSS